VGIKLEPDERGRWRAATVCSGGPADLAGLRAGDAVAAVDFRSLEVRLPRPGADAHAQTDTCNSTPWPP
jgi:C-terminal processing protease CtpA/Prc